MNDWISLISSVGFPIAACVFMGVYMQKSLKELSATVATMTSALQELTFYIKNGGNKNE
jgi:hypothetical protein